MNSIPDLSLCMIVRDEEKPLARCLSSLAPLSPQILIADTGSQDATVEVARGFGAEVFDFKWNQDFSAARNAVLERAGGRWILVLDADEWLREEDAAAIGLLSRGDPTRAFYLIQKNTDSAGGIIRNSMVRLFPNSSTTRFTHKVHEDVVTSLARAGIPIIHTDIEIEHSGYVDAARVGEKVLRNRAILERVLAEGCDPETEPHARYNLGVVFSDEGKTPEALEQFEWCIRNAKPGSLISRICTLRAAGCHFAMGQNNLALELLPREPLPTHHPTALLLGAKILHGRDPVSARPWLEALLAAPDKAQSPPVSLAPLKIGAVAALARIQLEAHQMPAARALLELAQQMKSGSVDAASETIAGRYFEITKLTQCQRA